jgi:CRP/FNR family transcriptional regulator, cyclic AMP receptor protein
MNPPARIAPQPGQVASVSTVPELSDTLSQALYELIAQQPFFKGLSVHHLQLLTDSALEMKFGPEQTIFTEGSPANRFYLILEGKVVLESETEERGVMIPIQTLGPGDDLGWSWFFPPYAFFFSARAVEPTKTIFFYGPPLREQCEKDHELGYQIMKRIAEVATQSLGTTQRRLMQYIDKNIPEQP